MKKLFVHLSLLCFMALLLVPMVACDRGAEEVEETPMATTDTTMMEEPAMDTGMTTDMGTDMMTTDSMTTEMTPPAQ